jgi:hypothetical protein
MMSDFEKEDGTERADLMQRLEVMECMIAEGRQSIMRCGWIFVLWGLVDCAGYAWQYYLPQTTWRWTWPVCLAIGALITVAGRTYQKRQQGYRKSRQCSTIEAVWGMMGVTLALYVFTAIMTHFAWQFSYVAGLMMIVGMAHAISAMILRWRAEGVVAAIWWAGGIAILCWNSHRATDDIFLLEMCLGMIAFGVYVMALERRERVRGRS